jgi:Icc-related predicted phosphoesterase
VLVRKLLIVGDVHGEERRLRRSLARVAGQRFDLALAAGDVGVDPPWREPERSVRRETHDGSVRQVLERIKAATAGPLLFVPGNHDLPAPSILAAAENVDRRIVVVGGLRVAGFGGAGPTRFGFPYEWTEEVAEAALANLFADRRAAIDVFLCHAPPAGTRLERTASGEAVGSAAVDRWLGRVRPRLFVCGHIHESWGVERRHGVPCLNAGALGEPYEQEIVWTVDWDRGPTAIHSHRLGSSGKTEHRSWPV